MELRAVIIIGRIIITVVVVLFHLEMSSFEEDALNFSSCCFLNIIIIFIHVVLNINIIIASRLVLVICNGTEDVTALFNKREL